MRVPTSRSGLASRPPNNGVPAPNTTGPIIRCGSSTRPLASRSFQSVRLQKIRMSFPVWRVSSAISSLASARGSMGVLGYCSVSSAVRLSDTTTLSMALLSRDISRSMGAASGSSATGGQ